MQLTTWLRLPLFRLAGVAQHAGHQGSLRERAATPGPASPRARTEDRPSPAFRLAVEVVDAAEGVVVRLRGEAGVAEARALEACLLPLVARRPARVTFDLAGLVLLSSLAMGVLVSCRRAVVRAGGRVCLAPDVPPAVRAALDRAALTGLFNAVADPEPPTRDGAVPGPGPGAPAAPHDPAEFSAGLGI
jgi:anti-anti-sigma factor